MDDSKMILKALDKIDVKMDKTNETLSEQNATITGMDARMTEQLKAHKELIENIAIVNFESEQGFDTIGCQVCTVPEQIFQRGDCNSDDKVDLADAAKILGWQFLGEPIDCPDASDANDDGTLDISDPVSMLLALFSRTEPLPPPVVRGFDRTADELFCVDLE